MTKYSEQLNNTYAVLGSKWRTVQILKDVTFNTKLHRVMFRNHNIKMSNTKGFVHMICINVMHNVYGWVRVSGWQDVIHY